MTVGKFKRSPWPNIASLGSIIICPQIEVGGGGLSVILCISMYKHIPVVY